MDSLFLGIIFAAVVVGFLLLLLYIRRLLLSQKPDGDTQSFLLLQQQISQINQTLDMKLGQVASESRHTVSEVNTAMRQQFGESQKAIIEMTKNLARVEEAAKQTLSMNEQIKKLQDTLTNPKQRGILGEYYLETVLKNVLPPGSYAMQHSFKDGVIVDAVVFVGERIIPIDSKFSLENYNRFAAASDPSDKKKYEMAFVGDIKIRIDETSKYVKPEEGTMDFAFMFIPSEAIYYDLLINKVGGSAEDKDLITYAFQKKVIIVSPTTFHAYLLTVLQGLRNQKISEQTEDIRKNVENLRKHMTAYGDYFGKIGKNLGTTVSMYEHARKEFGKIGKDVLKITDETIDVELEAIEGPAGEE